MVAVGTDRVLVEVGTAVKIVKGVGTSVVGVGTSRIIKWELA